MPYLRITPASESDDGVIENISLRTTTPQTPEDRDAQLLEVVALFCDLVNAGKEEAGVRESLEEEEKKQVIHWGIGCLHEKDNVLSKQNAYRHALEALWRTLSITPEHTKLVLRFNLQGVSCGVFVESEKGETLLRKNLL